MALTELIILEKQPCKLFIARQAILL